MHQLAHYPVSPPHSEQRGFSLLELMVVVVILGILVAIAIPSFKEMMANQRVKAAANDLLASFHLARSEAIKRNSNVYVVSGGTGWADGWAVTTSNTDTYATCSATTPPATCLRVQQPLAGMSVTLSDGGLTSVTYQRDGRFSASTTTPEIDFCITNAGKRAVTINLIGNPRVTVQGGCP